MKIYRKTVIYFLYDHVGEEMTMIQLLQECYGEERANELDTPELFRIDKRIREIAKTVQVKLDNSKYENTLTGLPFNIPFIIKKIPFGKEKKIRGNKYDAMLMGMDRETTRKIRNQGSPVRKVKRKEEKTLSVCGGIKMPKIKRLSEKTTKIK